MKVVAAFAVAVAFAAASIVVLAIVAAGVSVAAVEADDVTVGWKPWQAVGMYVFVFFS